MRIFGNLQLQLQLYILGIVDISGINNSLKHNAGTSLHESNHAVGPKYHNIKWISHRVHYDTPLISFISRPRLHGAFCQVLMIDSVIAEKKKQAIS